MLTFILAVVVLVAVVVVGDLAILCDDGDDDRGE